jgi:heme/copper-type cytochrome/quinol oxidase subunit 2
LHSIFWFSAMAFLVVQSAILVFLLLKARAGDAETRARSVRERHLEIVWTLVPASVLVALVLMMYGLTDGAWTRARTPAELRLTLVPQSAIER